MNTPDFGTFFKDVHGFAPFRWQSLLASRVIEAGWPEILDLPTGTGKTSALNVALWALAVRPEASPRRMVLVVDRRIIVDQAAEHASKILQAMRNAPEDSPRAQIASRLRGLFGAEEREDPFAVAILRGGMPRDNDWARRPDQPVVGVSTVDQVGSRILFRGYGVSPKSASIHAGLLGQDTLFLLDEVHLSIPFRDTLVSIRDRWRGSSVGEHLGSAFSRFAVVEMSATPQPRSTSKRFPTDPSSDGSDTAHPVFSDPSLAPRLNAKKPAKLQLVSAMGDDRSKRTVLAASAVEAIGSLMVDGARTGLIVVNRVETAQIAYGLLQEKRVNSALLTGRMRPIDRDQLFFEGRLDGQVRFPGGLLARTKSGRTRAETDDPLVVVATQCIEAGADLDFDVLVTEIASLDALRQRFGRLDRRGEFQRSRAMILAAKDSIKSDDPVYGEALGRTWTWLEGHRDAQGQIDFGIAGFRPIEPAFSELAHMLAPVARSPVLLPATIDKWSQTEPIPHPDPDIRLWLHGDRDVSPDVQIVWRGDVTDSDLVASRSEHLKNLVSSRRPHTMEAVSVPIFAARAWLSQIEAPTLADVDGNTDGPSSKGGSPTSMHALLWRGEDSRIVGADDLRAGDVLIVPAERGGLSAGNWAPSSREPVLDFGDWVQLLGRGQPLLRLHPATLKTWGISADSIPKVEDSVDGVQTNADLGQAVERWVDALLGSRPQAKSRLDASLDLILKNWLDQRNARRASKRSRVQTFDDGTVLIWAPSLSTRELARFSRFQDGFSFDSITEEDHGSFISSQVTLSRHSRDVERWARLFCQNVGLPLKLSEDVVLAAWLHDVGKADPRFQRWLVGGSAVRAAMLPEHLAKSEAPAQDRRAREFARKQAGYPVGYRHELLSLSMVESTAQLTRRAHDVELVLHLVASHHGWCRPFAPSTPEGDDMVVHLDHGGEALVGTSRHGKARLDSGVSDRYWNCVERYGWWGLAFLETILRLADHRASEEESDG